MLVNYLDELERILAAYSISKEDVCLTGSESLAVANIRPNHDLDVILRPSVRERYRDKFPAGYRWRINLSDNIELYRNHLHCIGISDYDIFHKGWFFVYEGFKVNHIEITYLLKKCLGRDKDKNDAARIKELFPDIDERAEIYRQPQIKIWYMKMRCRLQKDRQRT